MNLPIEKRYIIANTEPQVAEYTLELSKLTEENIWIPDNVSDEIASEIVKNIAIAYHLERIEINSQTREVPKHIQEQLANIKEVVIKNDGK